MPTIPPIYQDAKPSETLLKASALIKERKSNGIPTPRLFVLCGPTGTGKSWDSACIVQSLKKQIQMPMKWVDAANMCHLEGSEISSCYTTEILVIDDLGAGSNRANRDLWQAVINHRVNHRLFTIVNGNLPKQSENTDEAGYPIIDQRTISRLRGGFIVDYSGLPDLRVVRPAPPC